jgi:hypothetical protein
MVTNNKLQRLGFTRIDKTDVSREFWIHKSAGRFLAFYQDTGNIFLNGDHVGNAKDVAHLKTFI